MLSLSLNYIKFMRQDAHSRASDFNKLLDMDKLIETVIKYIKTEIKETS